MPVAIRILPRVPPPSSLSGISWDQACTRHTDVSHHYPTTTCMLPEIISICFGMVKMKSKNMFCQAVVSTAECLHVSNLLGVPLEMWNSEFKLQAQSGRTRGAVNPDYAGMPEGSKMILVMVISHQSQSQSILSPSWWFWFPRSQTMSS